MGVLGLKTLNPEPPPKGGVTWGLMAPYENRRFSIPLWGFSRGSGFKGLIASLMQENLQSMQGVIKIFDFKVKKQK